MNVFFIWFSGVIVISLIDKMIMTRIYLNNYDLARKILCEREIEWRSRGFGWMSLLDSGMMFRLSKAIVLRKDNVLITPIVWFLYLISLVVVVIGLVVFLFNFSMDILR